MRPEAWTRVKAAFEHVVALSGDEREAYLEDLVASEPDVAAEVRRLLAGDASDTFLGSVREQALSDVGPGPAAGERIGGYEIVRLIGHGGMGAVYEAVQDVPRRTVALKTLRWGLGRPQAVERFREEAEILGVLRHPAIAQVHEAGVHPTADGSEHLFIAMEYVERASDLVAFARDRELDERSRLQLMIEVCEGIQHAHQKGVIHRDLKPGNILVDGEGRPKVIDFGIARTIERDDATPALTEVGQVLGTLAYMSPEHLRGDPRAVDTRSDVYALGCVLFELLTGRAPLDVTGRSLPEVARLVEEQLPAVPGNLADDLRWILLRAMAKEPERRYASASELAEDLRRTLRHEPVAAGPPSAGYRLRKFVRRRRAPLAAAAAVFLALAIGLARAEQQRQLAEQQREVADGQRELADKRRAEADEQREIAVKARVEAETGLRQASAITDFLVATFTSVFPEHESRDVRVVDALGFAAASVDEAFPDDLLVRANVKAVIGNCYMSLGLPKEAMPFLREGYEYARDNLDERHPLAISLQHDYARLLLESGDAREAAELLRRNVVLAEEVFGPEHKHTLMSLKTLGTVLAKLSEYTEAVEMLRRAAEGVEATRGERDVQTMSTLNALGNAQSQAGRHDDALASLTRVLALRRDVLGVDHPYTESALHDLTVAFGRAGHTEGAVAVFQEIVTTRAERDGELHPDTIYARNNLGAALQQEHRAAEALEQYERAVEGAEEVWGGHSQVTIALRVNIAALLLDGGEFAESEAAGRKVLADSRFALPEDHYYVLVATSNLARAVARQGRHAEAETLARDVLQRGSDNVEANSSLLLGMRAELAMALVELGDDEAEALARDALAECEAALGADDGHTIVARDALALALMHQGRFDEAEPLMRLSVEQSHETDALLERRRSRLEELRRARAALRD